jgi:two-component SAPR family response regulator/Tfp pilus assembly protein PilF
MRNSPVIQTKIIPPPKNPRSLSRPQVTGALREALYYRLTLLKARSGYGKSTALTMFAEGDIPLIWYQVTEDDDDPLVFLLHLFHATRYALPDLANLPISYLESWEGMRGPLPTIGVMDQYLNALSQGITQPTVLVLDDIHLAASPEIELLLDRLISLAPGDFHTILASRRPLSLPNMYRWQAQGDVLTIDQSTLAFTPPLIDQLYTDIYSYELTTDEVDALSSTTEGWAIALLLIWQGLRSGASISVQDALERQATSLESLFDSLAKEVFEVQPGDVQDFLLFSSTLREMTPAACDVIRRANDSASMLDYLKHRDLFVVDQGRNAVPQDPEMRVRYHHIFHNFLRGQIAPDDFRKWSSRAAHYYQEIGNYDEAIFHLFRAEDKERAASLLDSFGSQLLSMGRLDSLAGYLDALPPEILKQHPALINQMGDLARMRSRFDEALGWYQQAEDLWRERGHQEGIARGLRGQARVYLDTVNPSQAEEILQQSIRLTDGIEGRESQARIYELLAENKLNAGQVEEAERLSRRAMSLRIDGPSESQLLYRVLLRTGRLDDAKEKLEAQAENERQNPVPTPRAHRETQLLLSLLYAFQGLSKVSYQNALEGTKRGTELDAPFTTAVGHMRQGHALMLLTETGRSDVYKLASYSKSYTEAISQFEESIQISRTLDVPRLRVEAFWGLCRAYGYQGELSQARLAAEEGIEIAIQAGDDWVASLVRLALGASFTLATKYARAENWLREASIGFQECSDTFGLSATHLWMSLCYLKQRKYQQLDQVLPGLLDECRTKKYEYIFSRPTLLGVPDERLLVPLLVYALQNGWEVHYCTRLMKAIGLEKIHTHPGYQLRVFTLGKFQTWRGIECVDPKGWRREKARQLFQILLTYRNSPLDREQIIDFLWPEMHAENAQRNFKVTLNTLNQVLEPERIAGSESAYILREGSTYGLFPEADLWVDSQALISSLQEAEKLIASDVNGAVSKIERALSLYKGEYLPDARYETWAAAEREHLTVLFLRSADRLADLYVTKGNYEGAIDLSQQILSIDNCWERAYRHMMDAYAGLGDHGQVRRTYLRCVDTLREEMDIVPSKETEIAFQQLLSSK